MTEQKGLAQMCLEYRARNNLKQTEMAELCGFRDRTIISNVENGKHVSRMTETKIRMTIEGRK